LGVPCRSWVKTGKARIEQNIVACPQDLTETQNRVRRGIAQARSVFAAAIAEKPAGRFMIRSRIRVVKRHPKGDW
jgi:hypothetical protein